MRDVMDALAELQAANEAIETAGPLYQTREPLKDKIVCLIGQRSDLITQVLALRRELDAAHARIRDLEAAMRNAGWHLSLTVKHGPVGGPAREELELARDAIEEALSPAPGTEHAALTDHGTTGAATVPHRHADGTVHEPPAWRDAIHKLFVGIIAWSGDEDGCFHEAVQPGIDAALAVLRDGSCSECGGAGWRWVNTPKGDCDMELRRCAHVPGCHCDDGGRPWHDADCPLSEDNRPTPTPTAPEGEECAPTCRTITQQVNSDWCHRCRQRMHRYAEGVAEPFCACGRRISECDGSRVGCGKRPTPTQKGGEDAD